MKVLYVGSQLDAASSLQLEREITELQRAVDSGSVHPVSFEFVPEMSIEMLPAQLARTRPDILHFSAHGAGARSLELRSESGGKAKVSAATIRAMCLPDRAPRLIYLNACCSAKIAKELLVASSMTVGTTANITNAAAIASVRLFYERLVHGQSVEDAYRASAELLKCISGGQAKIRLFCRKGVDPAQEKFHHVPRIVARPASSKWKIGTGGYVKFNLGLVGCAPATSQVVFFTDDEDLVPEDEDKYESSLCLVERSTPIRGAMWTNFVWSLYGDIRLVASAITVDGRSYCVGSTLCEAIVAHCYIQDGKNNGPAAKQAAKVITHLRERDGSDLPST